MAAQHFDKFFKGLGISDAFSLINMIPLRMLDINPKQLSTQMVNFNPTELMEIDLKAYRADLIMELDHVILMFEFQSTHIYLDDKRRFNIYTAIKDRARFGDKPIYIIVFSTVEDTKVIDYKVNPVSSFKILVISLKDYNAGEIINNIEIKIKNNQKINQNELINLALSPLMTLDGTIAQHLEKTVQTLSKLKKSIKENSKFVFTLTWILVDKFIEDEETRQKLSNILSDNMRLMEEFGQSKYEAGEQKGEQKGEKRGIVKTRQEI
ncbi:hypothetical protein, partial [Methanobrevibacter smithii]|uniref:hypothetical protein n=2 Tax=Methanobacteriaceae TaxID=2159 RepID=UPI0037DD57E2